jgi:protein-L-isoaspartate(D-aspartate) O-methyltransferase
MWRRALLLTLAGVLVSVPHSRAEDPTAAARARMVDQQIAARGVADTRVLEALRRVPRHRLVPEAERYRAYEDRALPIGHGQTISQPYVVAFMTEALELDGSERVLEIGTGSGYQAAVLAELAQHVYSIEIVAPLAERARRDLAELGYTNITLRAGDGYRGWQEFAPFDAIIVTAAPEQVPQPLVDQLAPGGRMIVPVGDESQDLVLLTRTAEGIERKRILPVRFVPMTGEAER